MGTSALLKPERFSTNRSELRQNQSLVLRKARGRTVVVVKATGGEDEKYVLGKDYFEELIEKLRGAIETLEIASDTKLFNQLLRAGGTMDKDIRLGKLHSFEEAFGEAFGEE
jgi:hypothetical protein